MIIANSIVSINNFLNFENGLDIVAHHCEPRPLPKVKLKSVLLLLRCALVRHGLFLLAGAPGVRVLFVEQCLEVFDLD